MFQKAIELFQKVHDETRKDATPYENGSRYAYRVVIEILRDEQASMWKDVEEILQTYTPTDGKEKHWHIPRTPEDGREFIENPRREVFCKHALRYCRLINYHMPLPDAPEMSELPVKEKKIEKSQKIIEAMNELGADDWHSPTDIGDYCLHTMPSIVSSGSAWVCPTLKALVRNGDVSRNKKGHYRIKRKTCQETPVKEEK